MPGENVAAGVTFHLMFTAFAWEGTRRRASSSLSEQVQRKADERSRDPRLRRGKGSEIGNLDSGLRLKLENQDERVDRLEGIRLKWTLKGADDLGDT